MNSRKNGSNGSFSGAGGSGSYSPKGKVIEGTSSGRNIEQLNHDMGNVSVDSNQEGEWEVIGKKSKNRRGPGAGGSSIPAPKAWGGSGSMPRQGWGANAGVGRPSGNNWAQAGNNGAGRAPGNSWSQGANNSGAVRAPGNSWAHADNNSGAVRTPGNWAQAAGRPTGRGNSKPQPPPRSWESAYMAPQPSAVPPPLQHGWQWATRSGSSGSQAKDEDNFSNLRQDGSVDGYDSESDLSRNQQHDVSDDEELPEDSDDDLSDDYDSDASQKSHETRKNNKWFKGFFEALDKLSVDEINEPSRQWHCPACQKGPGAIDWFTLQPLLTHAKTKGAKRAQLHRELAKLLDEELRRRGTSAIPAGEAFGRWRGLRETTTDHEIVWPPMVVVMNTLLEQDENEKWIGMGNQELLEYFNTYDAKKARHSYGPNGHRGMSLLMFEATSMGYLEAERLHKHFSEQGTDRDAWERRRVLFYPGGKRQLYGYLASKEDMEIFNHHCHGKPSIIKYEMKSYQEMVVTQMKQMSEDNQQLTWLKNKVVKQERHSKALEETFDVVSQKLRETMEENRIVRLRTKMQYEENKEEMDFQEQFFKEKMAKVQKDTEEKLRKYEILLQEERAKVKQSDVTSGSNEERRLRKEEIQRFMDSQVKGVEEFEEEREKLIRKHGEKKVELKRKYLEEEVELEKEFDTALTKLMEKYTPSSFETSSSS